MHSAFTPAADGLDPTLPSQAWSPSFLDKTAQQAAPMLNASADFRAAGGEIWVGETAMAWHSGRPNCTDSYLSGPWYISALGTLAATHSVHIRQTLFGGWYGLVDHFTVQPNPDFFTGLLFKRTMGERVLRASSSLPDSVLVYAHCARDVPGVTLAFVNLDNSTTFEVAAVAGGPPLAPRSEFVLTAAGGDTAARQVILNGEGAPLGVAGGVVSPTPPRVVTDPSVPLLLAPRTYGYIVLTGTGGAGVCSGPAPPRARRA